MANIKPESEKIRTGRKPDPATEERLQKIMEAIGNGVPYEIAAEANWISPRYLYECIAQGKVDLEHGDDTPKARLAQGIRDKELKDITSCLSDIREKEKSHKGAEWILERRFWKHFSSNVPTIELNEKMDRLEKELANQAKLKGEK